MATRKVGAAPVEMSSSDRKSTPDASIALATATKDQSVVHMKMFDGKAITSGAFSVDQMLICHYVTRCFHLPSLRRTHTSDSIP